MVNNDQANICWRNDSHQLEQTSDDLRSVGDLRLPPPVTDREAEMFRLSTFLQDNANPVLVFSPAGTVIKVNLAASRLLKQLALKPEALLPVDHTAIVQACLEGELEQHIVEVSVNQQILALVYHALPTFGIVYSYAIDLTEYRKAEDELLRIASNTVALAKRALSELQTFRQVSPGLTGQKFISALPQEQQLGALFVAMDGCIFLEKAVAQDMEWE